MFGYHKPHSFSTLCFDALFATAPLAPVLDTQHSLAYDQLYLSWRLSPDSAPAWHYSVEYRRRGVVPGGASRGGNRAGLAAARWGWQRLDEVSGTSAVIDRLEMDSVYVLRVRGCNKAGYGEYSEEVYLHTPPAPGEGDNGSILSGSEAFIYQNMSQLVLIGKSGIEGQFNNCSPVSGDSAHYVDASSCTYARVFMIVLGEFNFF